MRNRTRVAAGILAGALCCALVAAAVASPFVGHLKPRERVVGSVSTAIVTNPNAFPGVGQNAVNASLFSNCQVAVVPLAGGTDTAGGIGSWQNAEATPILVNRVIVDVTTAATAACNLDVGTTSTSATTLSDNLIDGLDVHTAIVTADNLGSAGTNGKSVKKLASGKWVTFSTGDSTASAGLVGYAYIYYTTVGQ